MVAYSDYTIKEAAKIENCSEKSIKSAARRLGIDLTRKNENKCLMYHNGRWYVRASYVGFRVCFPAGPDLEKARIKRDEFFKFMHAESKKTQELLNKFIAEIS